MAKEGELFTVDGVLLVRGSKLACIKQTVTEHDGKTDYHYTRIEGRVQGPDPDRTGAVILQGPFARRYSVPVFELAKMEDLRMPELGNERGLNVVLLP